MSLRFADHFSKSVFFGRLDSQRVFLTEKSAFCGRLDSNRHDVREPDTTTPRGLVSKSGRAVGLLG